MKKLLCILATALLLILAFTACASQGDSITPDGSNVPSGADTPSDTSPPDNTPAPKAGNILIAYFSCTNNTENIARNIAEITGGSIYKITPRVPYTSADLNYNTDCRANREQNDDGCRPEIDGNVTDMTRYDAVFIGYPIWWGQAPKIIYTFLESYDFSGKTVIPFCTSGSSGVGSSASNLHSLAPNAQWKDGKRFSGGASKDSVRDWVNGLELKLKTEKESMQLYVSIGGVRLAATLEDNAATASLRQRLKTAPITVEMSDYGDFEKVGGFAFELPASDEQITAEPCDIMLYQGNKLVIFYGSNSWSYTRLGKITGVSADRLKSIMGTGDVTVTLSYDEMNAIAALDRNEKHDRY